MMSEHEGRQILFIRDGGAAVDRLMVLGTVADLANEMQHLEYVDYRVDRVFALGAEGGPIRLAWEVRGGEFNEDDWAYPEVVVVFPDGTTESATYRVDGRA